MPKQFRMTRFYSLVYGFVLHLHDAGCCGENASSLFYATCFSSAYILPNHSIRRLPRTSPTLLDIIPINTLSLDPPHDYLEVSWVRVELISLLLLLLLSSIPVPLLHVPPLLPPPPSRPLLLAVLSTHAPLLHLLHFLSFFPSGRTAHHQSRHITSPSHK